MFKELAQDFIMKQVSQQIASKTGLNVETINKVVDEWVGSMIFGLAKNAGNPEEAKSLFGAVQNHDGSLLDNIWSIFGEEKQVEWWKILGHVFKWKETAITEQIQKDTGMDSANIMKILSTIAPIVLSMLGKQTKDNWFGLDDVVWMLTKEKEQVAQASSGLWIFGRMLDQDGDGDFDIMDAVKMAL